MVVAPRSLPRGPQLSPFALQNPLASEGGPGDASGPCPEGPSPVIDQALLDMLVCPLTKKAPLVLDGDRLVSTDPETRRAYRIRNGIPELLVDEAVVLSPEEHSAILARTGATPWKPKAKGT